MNCWLIRFIFIYMYIDIYVNIFSSLYANISSNVVFYEYCRKWKNSYFQISLQHTNYGVLAQLNSSSQVNLEIQ